MYNQNLSCELKPRIVKVQSESMAYRTNAQILRREMRRQSRKYVVRSLGQATAGGVLGADLFAIGFALMNYFSNDNFLLLLEFPIFLALGAGVGLVDGLLTLAIENIIDERLSVGPRVIVTSVIGILLLVGLGSSWRPIDWSLVIDSILPGTVLGFPVGLLIRSRLPILRALVYGTPQDFVLMTSDSGLVDSLQATVGLIGGMALRLVGAIGILSSTMVLAAWWYFQERDEQLVTIYAIYYFLCTAYISFTVRHRGVILGAGVLLNGLLLILALFWDHSAANDQPGAMLAAYIVLTFLWLLFLIGQRRPTELQTISAAPTTA